MSLFGKSKSFGKTGKKITPKSVYTHSTHVKHQPLPLRSNNIRTRPLPPIPQQSPLPRTNNIKKKYKNERA